MKIWTDSHGRQMTDIMDLLCECCWKQKGHQEVSLRNGYHKEGLPVLGSERGRKAKGLHRRMEMRIWFPGVRMVPSCWESANRSEKKGTASHGHSWRSLVGDLGNCSSAISFRSRIFPISLSLRLEGDIRSFLLTSCISRTIRFHPVTPEGSQ